MGAVECCSRRGPNFKKFPKNRHGGRPFYIHLKGGINIPKGRKGYSAGHGSPPSPFVVMWVDEGESKGRFEDEAEDSVMQVKIEKGEGKIVSIKVPISRTQVWPPRDNCVTPVWNTTKPVEAFKRHRNDKIHIALMDYSHSSREDIIAYTVIRAAFLHEGQEQTIQIPLAYKPMPFFPANILLTLKLDKEPPLKKTIFFVRHGKSIWNKAQERDLGMSAMFSEDHGLHQEGIVQCEALRKSIRDCLDGEYKSDSKRDEYIKKFLNAELILCSPLSRCLQTAVVGFQDHPLIQKVDHIEKETAAKSENNVKSRSPIQLISSVREQRNFGSKDCVSKYKGAEILRYSQEHISKYYGPDAKKPYFLKSKQRNSLRFSCFDIVDASEPSHKWWDKELEGSTRFDSRIRQFVEHIQFCMEKTIIVVGHSLWIRHFLRRHMTENAVNYEPKLTTHKIGNCGVIACDIEFGAAPEVCIIINRYTYNIYIHIYNIFISI
ncbi:hypothetical protein AAMO2058_000785100 [Amorphochlora amoebiformis]